METVFNPGDIVKFKDSVFEHTVKACLNALDGK